MPITFHRAPSVADGDRPTSTARNGLAQAFNDRLRSGVGDPSFRIFFYILSLFRQVRNSDGDLFPPIAEFFEFYQNLTMDMGEWPETGPGDPAGANVASFLNAFVFGADAIDVEAEASRITGTIDQPIAPSTGGTPAAIWNDGKLQRGAYDPDTGSLACPAFAAAQAYLHIRSSLTSPHGNAYGGFIPTPAVVDPQDPFCGDGLTLRTTLIFRKLADSTTLTFSSCNTGVFYSPFAYYIFVGGILTHVLALSEWIEGPYSGGGYLVKTSANALSRVVHAWMREFRGSTEQHEAKAEYHLAEAFDFERFFTTQYGLAPNIGSESGPDVDAVYPLYEWVTEGVTAAGEEATHTQSATSVHTYRTGFVLGSCHLYGAFVAGPVTVEAMDGTDVIRSITVSPTAGLIDALVVFDARTPSPLWFRLVTPLTLGAGGYLRIECTEQKDYKPQHWDAYLLLRLGTLDGNEGEGEGRDENGSKLVGDNYFATGVLHNIHGATTPASALNAVNTNAVFEAGRRMSQWVRCIPRTAILDYAVEGGKSVVWFSRYRTAASQTVDHFKGIAPSDVAVTRILPGYVYIAHGAVTYNEVNYADGQTFTGVDHVSTATGSGTVFEYEGIRAVAPPSPDGRNPGETNEWLFRLETMAYNPASSSIHKPESFADFFALNNRCQWYSTEITAFLQPDLVNHFTYGQSPNLLSESPSGYNYAKGTNDAGQARFLPFPNDFYKSCRIYEPDDEIESITMDEENVKVVFRGRFHHCDEAPSSILKGGATAGLAGWDLEALTAEPYRTRENAIRDYLAQSAQECPVRLGDCAISNLVGSVTPVGGVFDEEGLHGSCYPHFFFTKLIPLSFVDANDIPERPDTRITMDAYHQMELYLRSMCEGWMDKESSEANGCTSEEGCIVDWTFENLCFAAFGGRWIGFMSESKRPDNPQGYGPFPNTLLESVMHNNLAAAVNLLTRARLEAPLKVESRLLTFEDFTFRTPDKDTIGQSCTPPSGFAQGGLYIASPSISAGTLLSDSGWQPGVGNFRAGEAVSWATEAPLPGLTRFPYQCAGGTAQYKMRMSKSIASLRVVSESPDQDSLPPDLRAHVVAGIGIFVHLSLGRSWYEDDGGGEDACQDTDGINAWCWNDHAPPVSLTRHEETSVRCIAVDGEAQLEPFGTPQGVTIGTAFRDGESNRSYSSGISEPRFGCHGGSYANFGLTG